MSCSHGLPPVGCRHSTGAFSGRHQGLGKFPCKDLHIYGRNSLSPGISPHHTSSSCLFYRGKDQNLFWPAHFSFEYHYANINTDLVTKTFIWEQSWVMQKLTESRQREQIAWHHHVSWAPRKEEFLTWWSHYVSCLLKQVMYLWCNSVHVT